MTESTWDTLIRNALVFDGTGAQPAVQDVAIRHGRIMARGEALPAGNASEVIDADGLWLLPGMVDIHTHLDLEVEVNPGLGEAVRHGTTAVVVGNCSLGTAFGAQEKNGESPIIDCFTRVENMPKRVLQKCVDKMSWDNTADYLKHFETLPLGPNIAPLLPHSMLRAEVMGVHDSVTRLPTIEELEVMKELTRQAMDQGYIGFSTDSIIFHYLANDPHKEKRIPTQFASEDELKSLISIVREYDRVWQATPDSKHLLSTLKRFFWTSGRLFGKPLRVSALTALDFKSTPGVWKRLLRLAKLLNSSLLKGRFHFQALSTNFRMWGNGVQAPIFEELESTRALIAYEVDDIEGRRALMETPEWQAQFREDWQSVSPASASWLTKLGVPTATFQLDPDDIFIDPVTPVASWHDQPLSDIYLRFQAYRQGRGNPACDDERSVFDDAPKDCDTLADFFAHCLRRFDLKFRWWLDVANLDADITERILFDENTLPGFNDSGAHITNLAFYDGNLLTLQIAQRRGLEKVAQAVHRLTRAPAEFFNLDVGTLDVGAQADVVLINPESLKTYDSNARRELVYNPHFEHDVLVNRSDGVVEQVYIRGRRVWEEAKRFTEVLGSETLGRALTAVN
ncbi:N-acyl-D-aspartate/D-glutamate deacylase [Litorivivens lipolytica]|uniref:N-acyl-D-aspartate/D-glutamate deacylase n=1 Tax=Litorivivens lipolytica TaxID=1524264 RepID=A0A7W4W2X4_9GAMM|nr:amidohydrolase family protein [Litorivivens lipolytica]MBB3046446.1 N-acyl-D-aspartate/D-glutamate deacylase [Litorivivens lipolytica]